MKNFRGRVVVAVMLVLASTSAGAKDDIEGFKLGMPANAVIEKISGSQYRCTPVKYPGPTSDLSYKSVPLEIFCKGSAEELKLSFSKFIEGNPLLQVQRTFSSSLSGQAMLDRVRAEYQLGEGKVSFLRASGPGNWNGHDEVSSAEWSDGPRYIRLGVLHQRYELRLTSTEMIQKDKEAGATRQGR